jgi:hypothetical protein
MGWIYKLLNEREEFTGRDENSNYEKCRPANYVS